MAGQWALHVTARGGAEALGPSRNAERAPGAVSGALLCPRQEPTEVLGHSTNRSVIKILAHGAVLQSDQRVCVVKAACCGSRLAEFRRQL